MGRTAIGEECCEQPLHATNNCVSGIACHAPIDIGSDLSRTMYS